MLVSLTNFQIWAKSELPKVPIILTTYHRKEAFKKCILPLYNSTDQPIYIIDNSCGGLDKELLWAKTLSENITIFKNNKNIGKAASIQLYYKEIAKDTQWFISMDSDIIVRSNDIDNLIKSGNELLKKGYPVSLLAPALNSGNNPILEQIKNNQLDTHKIGTMYHLENGLYINEFLAGCLLLINTLFFNEIGGFKQQKIYGGDDGELSKITKQNEMISVLNTNVECVHYRLDETKEYIKWKKDNITKPSSDQVGHLD